MEEIIRNVRDIGMSERRALEHVLGQPLGEDQQVVIHIVNPNPPSEPAQNRDGGAPAPVPAWWNVYEGLDTKEVERLDQAIRPRADLTRLSD